MSLSTPKLVKYLKIRYADPICALELNNNLLTFGTMLGRIGAYNIQTDKFYSLSNGQDEHITGIQYMPEYFVVTVGDEKILKYKYPSELTLNEIPFLTEIKVYDNEGEHNSHCENCHTMLYKNYLLQLFIKFPEQSNEPVENTPIEYKVKNIETLEEDKGTVNMSNYGVPFDYNGKLLAFVNFVDVGKRVFNLYKPPTQETLISKEMPKEEFGHFSHVKLLKNDKMFIVENYNSCGIWNNATFKCDVPYLHLGEEVLACDVYYVDDNYDDMLIVTLDISASVCAFNLKTHSCVNWFNLHDLKDIEQSIKDQKFFSVGYPYYIKITDKFIAITSDYGCILLNYE